MEQDLQQLSLQDKLTFTLEEFTVLSKTSSNEFKIHFPKEILDYMLKDEPATSGLIDEERFKKVILSKVDSDKTIDMTECDSLTDKMILKAIFGILGSVNSKNDFLQFTSDDYLSNIEEEHYIENFLEKNYLKYLDFNIPIIFSTFKLKDLDPFINALKFIGVDIMPKNTDKKSSSVNPIYTKIRNFVMSKNKILIVVTPSNNFWIKSEKITIGSKNYDKKINNYSMIFYNWNFIKKFYDRFGSHPRVAIGFLNSMVKKNLQPCIDTIPIAVKNFTKYILFDQDVHENTNPGPKPSFVRHMDKMKTRCKSYEDSVFNETSIIILESEPEKMGASTKANSIPMCAFPEEYLTSPPEVVESFDKKNESIFNYLESLLSECFGDVREYIVNNPLN